MLSLHPLSLSDKPWIDEYVFKENSRSADFNFGSMFMWDGRYHQLVGELGGRMVTLTQAHLQPIFPFPIGEGPLEPVITEMRGYARAHSFPFVIRGIEEKNKAALEAAFGTELVFRKDVDHADYIYSAEKLSDLSGKKLHGKRNHINRFTAEHDWRFEPLTREHFSRCLELLAKWDEDAGEDDSMVSGEHDAICRAFDNYDALSLMGGALFAEGALIGFTIGEKISDDTVDVHFEKAEAEINGAYSMINREFVLHVRGLCPEIKYFNREDDMGLVNLRKAKESYQPEFMLEKYSAHWFE